MSSKISDIAGVMAVKPCIDGTRITVKLMCEIRHWGMTTILRQYPTLKSEQVQAAWDYADENCAEIKSSREKSS